MERCSFSAAGRKNVTFWKVEQNPLSGKEGAPERYTEFQEYGGYGQSRGWISTYMKEETGNFDSSLAMYVLSTWIMKIVDDIRVGFLYDSHDTLYRNLGEGQIVANIDILVTLCEHYKTYPELRIEEVAQWKSNYLATFDRVLATYPNVKISDYAIQRRAVIEQTFDRLEHLVNELWDDL